MRISRAALLGAAASLVLAGGVGAAWAQGQTAAQGRVIAVPRGAVVIVLPGGAMPMGPMMPMTIAGPGMGGAFPFAGMPDAAAMMRQANQMLNQMLEAAHGSALSGFARPAWIGSDRTVEAAMQGVPQLRGTVRGVFVTSVSDGHGTCTQRVTYGGNGAAPKVEVSSTGDGCASQAVPMTSPSVVAPTQRAVPRTWQVEYRPRPARRMAPVQVAQLGN